MGIWGNLSDIQLPDLLLLLEERDGVLIIQPSKRPAIAIEIVGGRVGAVREGKRPLPFHRLEERLLALMRTEDASFNFRPDDLLPPARGPKLSALALRISALHEEIESVRRHLPAPNSRFVLKDPSPMPNPRWSEVFERARKHLRQGTSALELADLLRIPLPVAQHFLYVASRARRIAPERNQAPRRFKPQWLIRRPAATP